MDFARQILLGKEQFKSAKRMDSIDVNKKRISSAKAKASVQGEATVDETSPATVAADAAEVPRGSVEAPRGSGESDTEAPPVREDSLRIHRMRIQKQHPDHSRFASAGPPVVDKRLARCSAPHNLGANLGAPSVSSPDEEDGTEKAQDAPGTR